MALAKTQAGVVVGLLLSLITASRVPVWGDEARLWSEATRQSPQKPRPWVNLANMLANRGATDMAIRTYQTAIRRASLPSRSRNERVLGRALAEANLAILTFRQGDRETAMQMVDAIVARDPSIRSVVSLQAWMQRQE